MDDNDVPVLLDFDYYWHEVVMTTMTRQHFQFIAKVLKNLQDREAAFDMAHEFGFHLLATNPLFDESKFIEACQLEDEDWLAATPKL